MRVKGTPTIFKFDTEQEWSSGVVFNWIQEQWKNSDAANRVEPKAESKAEQTPEFPEEEVLASYRKRYQLSSDSVDKVLPVATLCGSLKKWVLDINPKLRYVNMGAVMGIPKGIQWQMWGWETIPGDCHPNTATWRHSIVALKAKAPELVKAPADPDTKSQLAVITDSLKALTAAVAALAAKV